MAAAGLLGRPPLRRTLAHMKVLTRDEIARLSPSERLTVIGDLWDSLDDTPTSRRMPTRPQLERLKALYLRAARAGGASWP